MFKDRSFWFGTYRRYKCFSKYAGPPGPTISESTVFMFLKLRKEELSVAIGSARIETVLIPWKEALNRRKVTDFIGSSCHILRARFFIVRDCLCRPCLDATTARVVRNDIRNVYRPKSRGYSHFRRTAAESQLAYVHKLYYDGFFLQRILSRLTL